MTIFTQLPNPLPMEQTEFATKMATASIAIPQEVPTLDFCFCDYECDFEELVLADLADNSSYKNDRTSFLLDVPDTGAGSFAIRLIAANGTTTNLVDNTYGTYFGLSTIAGQPTKAGYLIEWQKVATLLGFGVYYFEVDNTNFTNTITTTSRKFRLTPYSETNADGTVKIETIHNGCIEGGVDYTGMNWIRSIRIPGIFGKPTFRLETDNYFDTQNNKTQIRDQIVHEYTLQTERLPSSVMAPIINDKILANQIFITDYNLFNFEDIRQKEVIATEIAEPSYASKSRKASFEISFEEKLQNTIKRN